MAYNSASRTEVFQKKVDLLREAMKEERLSALLFYSSGQLSMLEVNPVLWISGVLPMGPHTAVLLNSSGDDATILISLSWDLGRVKQKTWIGDVRVADRFSAGVGEWMRQRGIAGELGITD